MIDLTSGIGNTFELARGDTATPIVVQLVSADGSSVDLTAATIKLNVKRICGVVWKQYTMTADSPSGYGYARYSPTGTEFLIPGKYYGNVKATLSTGKVLTVPSKGFFLFQIEEANG